MSECTGFHYFEFLLLLRPLFHPTVLKDLWKIQESVQQTRNIWVSALISLILNSLCCCDLHIFVSCKTSPSPQTRSKMSIPHNLARVSFWVNSSQKNLLHYATIPSIIHQIFSYSAINSSEKSKNSTKQKSKCSGIHFLSLLLAFSMLVVGHWCDRC